MVPCMAGCEGPMLRRMGSGEAGSAGFGGWGGWTAAFRGMGFEKCSFLGSSTVFAGLGGCTLATASQNGRFFPLVSLDLGAVFLKDLVPNPALSFPLLLEGVPLPFLGCSCLAGGFFPGLFFFFFAVIRAGEGVIAPFSSPELMKP